MFDMFVVYLFLNWKTRLDMVIYEKSVIKSALKYEDYFIFIN